MNSQVAQRGRDRTTVRGIRRVSAVVLATVVLALAGSVLTAPPASAHASVMKSDPADQAHVPTSPPAVTIVFSEAVSKDVGGMSVLSQDGKEVQTAVEQPEPNTLRAPLKPDLPDGTYVATYRIISEDGHPISGSIVFAVGSGQLADVSGLEVKTDPALDIMSKAGQFLTYVGALAAAGLVFFLASIYAARPGAGEDDGERRRLARYVRLGAALTVVGMVVVVLAQTAQATGQGLGAAFTWSNLEGVLRQGLGAQDLGVLAGLILVLTSLSLPPAPSRVTAWIGGLLTAASFVLWGHAAEGTDMWLTIPADAIHLVVAAVWFGGLVGLFVVLRSRSALSRGSARTNGRAAPAEAPVARAAGAPAEATAAAVPTSPLPLADTVTAVLDDPAPVDGGASLVISGRDGGNGLDPAGPGGSDGTGGTDLGATVLTVRRFSAAAFVSLVVLTAAGVAVGLVEMGGVGNLFSTNYGRLLLAKLAIVGIVAAVAGYNRFFLLPWLLEDTPELAAVNEERQRAGWRTLLATVRFEALAIVVVLVVTAVLVNTTPAGSSSAKPPPSGPFKQSLAVDGGQATLEITPNRPGVNSMHVMVLGADGKPKDVVEATIAFTLEEKGVGPIERKLSHDGPGMYMLMDSRDLTLPGEWEIRVVLRTSEFDETPLVFKDSVS